MARLWIATGYYSFSLLGPRLLSAGRASGFRCRRASCWRVCLLIANRASCRPRDGGRQPRGRAALRRGADASRVEAGGGGRVLPLFGILFLDYVPAPRGIRRPIS
jgi:hypothetical protein